MEVDLDALLWFACTFEDCPWFERTVAVFPNQEATCQVCGCFMSGRQGPE